MRHKYRTSGQWWLVITLLTAVAVPATGQPRGDRPGGDRPEGRRGGGRGQHMERMVERVAGELDLDEAQRAEFDAIVAEQRERMTQMRELFRAVREAEESGDQALADELRADLPSREGGMRNHASNFFDRIEPILRQDQLPALNALRERGREWGGGPTRRLERLAEELELDDAQQPQFDELAQGVREQFSAQRDQWREMRPMMREMRTAREEGDEERIAKITEQFEATRAARGDIMDGFYVDVKSFLREDQIERLDVARERMQSRREARGMPGMRGGWGMGGGPGMMGRGPGMGGRRGEGQGRPGFARGGARGGGGAQGAGNAFALRLNGLEERLDFDNALALDEKQRKAFDDVIREARKQTEPRRAEGADRIQGVFKNLRPILRDDQLKAFGQLEGQVISAASTDQGVDDVRLVLRAARSITLNAEQTRTLRSIQKQAAKEFRRVRRDKEALTALASGVKQQIIEMLDDRQTQRFQRRLDRLTRRAGSGRRSGRTP